MGHEQTDSGALEPTFKRGTISRRDFLKWTGGALLLAGCTPQQAETPAPTAGTATAGAAGSAASRPTGEVRFLMAENFWADWSPYASTALSQRRLEREVYDYLVEFPSGDVSQPEPALATSWEQVDDVTWEFVLREGVTFHDGQRLSAEDVKASVELASGFSGESAYSLNWLPAEVEVVDNLTVRIRTERTFAPMLAELWWTPILSAEWLEGDPERLTSEPNGTGPFRLVSDQTNVKTMEANTDYWRRPAQIQTLIWEFIQDPQTRLNALLAGEAQAIDRLPPQHLSVIEGRDAFGLISVTGIESVNLYVRPGRLSIWDENAQFRQAVNWSIDRRPLVENLVLGNSHIAQSFIPTNALFFKEQEPLYTLDADRARSALEEAGVPDGGPEFELWVAEGFLPRSNEVVEAVVSQMQHVGLKPQVVTSDVSGMIDDAFSDGGTGAMYHLSWASNGDANAAAQVYSNNFAWFFGDDRLQELIEQGLTTVDEAQRRRVYADLQAHMWEQAWHVPLYNSDFSIAHSSDLEGIRVLPNVFLTDFYPARLAA